MPTKRNHATRLLLPPPDWVTPEILQLREKVLKLTPFQRKYVCGLSSGHKGRPKGIKDNAKRKRRSQDAIADAAIQRMFAGSSVSMSAPPPPPPPPVPQYDDLMDFINQEEGADLPELDEPIGAVAMTRMPSCDDGII